MRKRRSHILVVVIAMTGRPRGAARALCASAPISPPGKKIGCTTCESVVMTSQRSPMRMAAPSSMARSPTSSGPGVPARPSIRTSAIRRRIARPPAPCFMRMRSSPTRVLIASLRRSCRCPTGSADPRRTGARSGMFPRCSPCRRPPGSPAGTPARTGGTGPGTKSRP